MKNELSFKSQNETTPFDQKARELVGLKMALYSAPDQREVLRSINDWYTLVKAIDPACQESRRTIFLSVALCRRVLPGLMIYRVT